MLANGVNPQGMTLPDVADIADILAATGRTVPAIRWVESLADAAIQAEQENSLANILG